ncbi:hypothetical protein DRE_04718 [Drechslerella stenobrocha 248]|uniref:H/ACA ribonucleoprotein complex non-core subunit NAF1 n=1 Tax=Drechslerella stenobrocha 248 TaxID=1043628 RepID=W7HSE6_9PEZI|nr:hypothetical protein DRE_04718 [Drechslerella stenobrocha 248]
MDDDHVFHGDTPEYRNATTSDHDSQPLSKRARLSPEQDRSPVAVASSAAKPPSITEKSPVSSLAANAEHISATGSFDVPPPSNDAIPGLFLVNDNPLGDNVESKTTEEVRYHLGSDDQRTTTTDFANSDQNCISPCLGTDASEGDDRCVIRDLEDFLEKGKANLGDPGAEWQLDSSAEEESDPDSPSDGSPSSSGDDTSSTSPNSDDESSADDEDEGEEDAIFLDIQKEARRLMDEDGGSGDDDGNDHKKGMNGPLRTKNELPETRMASARPNIDISASTPIVPLGVIDSVIGDLVLVKATVSGEYQVLNEQSLLCFEDRCILGQVQETFGRVEQPFYTVRLKDAGEVEALNATVGRKVDYIPSHSTFLFTKTIRTQKGSDASNLHDEEVGDDDREFSDDEAEAEFKRRQKEEKKARGSHRAPNPGSAPDVMDEPYVPLSRPANLHEMSAPPPPPPQHAPQSFSILPQRREIAQRPPIRENQGSNRGFKGRGRGRAGRQPFGRPEPKPNVRRQNQSADHQKQLTREVRQPVSRPEPVTASNHHQGDLLPRPPPSVVQPAQDLSAFLPFLNPTQQPPQVFPSGAHINPAFFPMPINPQLPFASPVGQLPTPCPPTLNINSSQFPLPPPPSIEEILHILRSQGHNI